VDVVRGGKTTKTLVHAGRNGYIWLLDRADAALNFVDAWPFVKQNVFTGVDRVTGRPAYDPARVPHTGKKTEFCPSAWGGKDWPPEAYSPDTGLYYVPANNNLCGVLTDGPNPVYSKGEFYIGVTLEDILNSTRMGPDARDHIGEVQAWNLNTGKSAWVYHYKEMNWGPLMVTAGNLLFGGGTNDRQFHAYDARSGKLLWQYPAPSGIIGVP